MRRARVALHLLLVTLVIPFVIAAQGYTQNATPIVTVVFDEAVSVQSANVTMNNTNASSAPFAARSDANANMQFGVGQFTTFLLAATERIVNGNYTATVAVADIAANPAKFSYTFQVDAPTQKITLLSPRNGGITNQTVTFSIGTEFPSTCRWSQSNRLLADPELFGLMNTFTTEDPGKTIHTMPDILGVLKRQLAPDESVAISVTCFDGKYYTPAVFSIIYLTHGPTITMSQNPNPIIDPYNPVATLTVAGNQDVWCNDITEPAGTLATFGPNDYPSYGANITTRYHDDGSQATITRNITLECTNRAGFPAELNTSVAINYVDPITITVTSPQFTASKTYNLTFTTSKGAACTAAIGSTPVRLTPGPAERGTDFISYIVTLTAVTTTFTIRCTTPFNGDNSANFVVTQDTDPPKLTRIITDPNTCDLRQIHFTLNATDNGSGIVIAQYNIQAANGTIILAPRNITITSDADLSIQTPSLALVNNTQLNIIAQVYDRAGNPSTKLTQQTKATDGSLTTCDKTQPNVGILQRQTTGGTNATLFCTDKQSGCRPTYQYSIMSVNSSKSCFNNTMSTGTVGATTLVTQESFYCYIVKDFADNVAQGTERIFVGKVGTIPGTQTKVLPATSGTCNDGIKNQDETDVDCGGYSCGVLQYKTCAAAKTCTADADCASAVCSAGVCAASSCSDKKQDGNETDVDCGGTCAACAEGLRCALNSDCEAGTKCLNKFCAQPPQEEKPAADTSTSSSSNLGQLILLILGSLTTLGGAGYSVLYKPPVQSGRAMAQTASGTDAIARFRESTGEHGDELTSTTPERGTQRGAVQRRTSRERRKKERDAAFTPFESGEDVTKLAHVTHKEVEQAFKDLNTPEATDAIKQLITDEKISNKDISIALKDLESGGHLDGDAIESLKQEFNITKENTKGKK